MKFVLYQLIYWKRKNVIAAGKLEMWLLSACM